MKLWLVCNSFCMFPGHAVLSLPRYMEGNHYYCVNADVYRILTYTASTT
jgi:hypothetical protein